jgi:CheY-like chemotaxis protein
LLYIGNAIFVPLFPNRLQRLSPQPYSGFDLSAVLIGHDFLVLYQIFTLAIPELHLEQVCCGLKMEGIFETLLLRKWRNVLLNDEPVDILVVEDNDNERTLNAAITEIQVVAVHSGTEALDFLFARGNWMGRVGAEPPRLLLLDLELPGADGLSILGQIRALDTEDALMLTPVVIFSDSQDARNIEKCYRCGANSYIKKPLSFPDFQAMVRTIGQYWMMHNIRSS